MIYLVDKGKVDAHAVSNGRRSFGATGVGADNDGFLVVWNVLHDVPLKQRSAVQVIDRHIEESLDWIAQKVNMAASSH